MAFDYLQYQPQGDKKNSEFFETYREKIYQWRQENGLNDLVGAMRGVVIQVQTGDAINYLAELYVMTPYRLAKAYKNATHTIYVLKNTDDTPLYFILEPIRYDYVDETTRMNRLSPGALAKDNARYIGEIFYARDLKETVKLIGSHDIRFHDLGESANAFYAGDIQFTIPSSYTNNRFGYSDSDFSDLDALNLGKVFELDAQQQRQLEQADQFFHEKGFKDLLIGVDHMATRILSSSRECAILEFLTCSSYYFWGAYNIDSMNSSTNVNRNPNVDNDRKSPAKVFTANNTPYFVNALEGNPPMPTETFVRNLGARMHHIAQEVKDGDHVSGQKNIDYVVNTIKEYGVPFLAHVVGECTDSPDLKQIFSKRSPFSMLITEYVERCHNFDGFFTKTNVASLTAAAGLDETIGHHGHVFD